MKLLSYAFMMMTAVVALPACATVIVSSPANGASVGSSVNFVATATTSTCSKGVASMGIYVDNSLDYTVGGASLNTTLSLSSGTHRTVLQEWDYCGGATTTTEDITVSTAVGVTVTSPANGATVPAVASYVASATSSCAKGVASMGVYVDGTLGPVVSGSSMNTQVSLSSGTHNTVVQSWDYCGGSEKKAVAVTVATGTTLSNLQATGGWNQWGELAPVYAICSPCSGVNWAMYQHESSVSLSGNATQFTIGGTTPYSDVLWSNPVLGQGSTEGLPDTNHKLLPTIHNMTLDTEVYITDFAVTQDLEFDVNLYMNSVGMEWGTQCNHLADGDWDIWNNVDAHWVSTGVACKLNNGAWNHIVIQAQRESNNDLLYQSISVNGTTYTINKTVAPFAVSSSWWGMTVNYQMDGNYKQASNTTYVDKMSVTYW